MDSKCYWTNAKLGGGNGLLSGRRLWFLGDQFFSLEGSLNVARITSSSRHLRVEVVVGRWARMRPMRRSAGGWGVPRKSLLQFLLLFGDSGICKTERWGENPGDRFSFHLASTKVWRESTCNGSMPRALGNRTARGLGPHGVTVATGDTRLTPHPPGSQHPTKGNDCWSFWVAQPSNVPGDQTSSWSNSLCADAYRSCPSCPVWPRQSRDPGRGRTSRSPRHRHCDRLGPCLPTTPCLGCSQRPPQTTTLGETQAPGLHDRLQVPPLSA